MFYLGVDGGGTKTEFMIMNHGGDVLGFHRNSTCHYKQTSLKNFEDILNSGINEVCKKANISIQDLKYSVLGIPGYGEIEDDISIIHSVVGNILETDSFHCINDAIVGWAGSLGCKPGINIVAGTGAIGYGMDNSGQSARVGGWGHNCGDEGSAYWIGKKLIELFTKQSDGRMEKTPLYNIVRRELNLEKDFDLISLVLDEYKLERNKIANLSLIIYKASEQGDLLANKVFCQAAYEHYLMIKALVEKLDFSDGKEILISYSGGVFKSGDYILGPLTEYIKGFNKNIKLIEPLLEPISGATLYAYDKINNSKEKNLEIINKLQLYEKRKNKYAVPAFNIYNLETFQSVLEAICKLKSPAIIATTPGTVNYAEMEYLLAIVKAAAKKYNIPIALHLDHCSDIDFIKKCIIGGYKSVMIDGSMMTYEENLRVTKEVVAFAHSYDASVEAELGRVGGVEDESLADKKEDMLTDPKMALDFVKRTKIDSLAVAIGTAHGLYEYEPKLDFHRLKEIKDIIDIPIVLHGGSGVAEENIEKAIRLGICKVNIATELKIPFAESIQRYFKENPKSSDPRHYFRPGKEAIMNVAMDKIRICGSGNKL